MSGTQTKRMISAYNQQAPAPMFLAGKFQSPAMNFHNSAEVEIDIQRGDEEIAIVIQDLSAGYRMNSADIYTNKSFVPPILKEACALNAFNLIKRMPGKNPFEDPGFREAVIMQLIDHMNRLGKKIRRTVELQASQILTTGIVTLVDADGTELYKIDFKPKVTHFPTVGTAWNAVGADPVNDILGVANVVRNDGLSDPDELIMGEGSFEHFIQNEDVQKRFDNRRIDMGALSRIDRRGQGGNYRGVVNIGNYQYDVWTYGGRYIDPNGGAKKQFVADDKVIVRASDGRLDATFGAIPNIGKELGQNPVNIPELPSRFSNAEGGMDLHTNVWISPNGEELFGGVGSRPLLIPTAIDTYGCLDTGI